MKLDYSKALRFKFTVRYIDDLLTLNNTLFVNEISNIYPQELVLNRTSESDVHVSYLDIIIFISQNFFKTNMYAPPRPFPGSQDWGCQSSSLLFF